MRVASAGKWIVLLLVNIVVALLLTVLVHVGLMLIAINDPAANARFAGPLIIVGALTIVLCLYYFDWEDIATGSNLQTLFVAVSMFLGYVSAAVSVISILGGGFFSVKFLISYLVGLL